MKLTTRLFPPVRRVRVWALVNPRGRVALLFLSRRAALEHVRRTCVWLSAHRAGWRVRRLKPEEVAP